MLSAARLRNPRSSWMVVQTQTSAKGVTRWERPTHLFKIPMKYIFLLSLFTVAYLAGYNRGTNEGYQEAVQYAPGCHK